MNSFHCPPIKMDLIIIEIWYNRGQSSVYTPGENPFRPNMKFLHKYLTPSRKNGSI